jgi:predicted RNA-binding protein with PIN domain
MPYLIDGHNLIGKMSGVSLSDIDDEMAVVQLLDIYFTRKRKKAEIFFDKANLLGQTQFRSAFLEVRFVRQPKTADEAIVERLEKLRGNANNFIVISSDKWVMERAAQKGARVISSQEFQQIIENDQPNGKKDRLLSQKEVEDWLDLFQNNS